MDPKTAYLSKPWLNHYSKGVLETVEIPDISVPQLFDKMAEKYAKHAALIFYGKKISYRELKMSIDRMACAFADLGVQKGDTVAIYLMNCPQYVISDFGADLEGCKIRYHILRAVHEVDGDRIPFLYT